MDLERSILSIIRGEKKAPILLICLAFLSLVYRAVLKLRNFAYDRGVIASEKLPVPVISVGNIVAGGTGKTPLTHALAIALQDRVRLAILSRGYKSQIERSGDSRQISTGLGPLCRALECGDEPYFLAQKTRAAIWVGPDRVASGRGAIKCGANCLLLDDGMQHRKLKRDFEIVVVDGIDPLSKGRYLPWGFLRDSPKRLQQASLIVLTHIKDFTHFQERKAQISLLSQAPVIATQMEVLQADLYPPGKVGVFCGIGQPSRFLQTVRDLNQEIVDTLILSDHAELQEDQLARFAKQCLEKGAKALLCTEKDHVKLCLNDSLGLEIFPVKIQLKIIHGKEHWEQLIDNILDRTGVT